MLPLRRPHKREEQVSQTVYTGSSPQWQGADAYDERILLDCQTVYTLS